MPQCVEITNNGEQPFILGAFLKDGDGVPYDVELRGVTFATFRQALANPHLVRVAFVDAPAPDIVPGSIADLTLDSTATSPGCVCNKSSNVSATRSAAIVPSGSWRGTSR